MPLDYVLVTPAHDEAALIEHTLAAVTAQTVLPRKWVIVDDGSTDGTGAIVQRWQAGRPWIELVRRPPRARRDFAAKVHAFRAGYERVATLPFDVVGNLDADVSFDTDYMAYLLERFARDPRLGVAGTHYVEGDFHSYEHSYMSPSHVNGQCQLFRRECFDAIGGYQAIASGGIDWVAVTTARMRGWRTQSFAGRTFTHHRKTGTAAGGELRARFAYGMKDYYLGGHPLWQVCRSAYQLARKPYVVGGLALMAGYAWCWATRPQRPIAADLVAFHRGEQLERLRALVRRPFDVVRRSARNA